MFGPRVEENDDDEVPAFYISLNVHDIILHNSMLDSRASHNLMPKVIMDSLGLLQGHTRIYFHLIQEKLDVCV